MKKLVTLLLISLICTSATVFAEGIQEKGYILLHGSATKEVSPNIAEITFSVVTNNKDSKVAMLENNKTATNIINGLKAKIDEKKDTIKTGNISISPNYTYSKDGKQNLNNYTARNTIIVKTTNTEKLSELIDIAVSNGANTMNGLSFSFTDETKICSELYPQIVTNLKKQANMLVSSLNSSITGIKFATTSCGTQYSMRHSYVMNAKSLNMADEMDTSTPVESGKIKVNASMEVQFFVK